MKTQLRSAFCLALLLGACSNPSYDAERESCPAVQSHWQIDNVTAIGRFDVQARGAPRVIDDSGPALEFDGIDDAIVLGTHPLCGAREFTAEIVFRPSSGGEREQRFLHLQESASKDRILFETRMVGDDRWFLDTYVKSKGEGYTLFAKEFVHPADRWYHAALVVDGEEMRHYVDGVLELSRPIDFVSQGPGRTSIGMRINEVSWFRGAVREVRFTPSVLQPEAFLEP